MKINGKYHLLITKKDVISMHNAWYHWNPHNLQIKNVKTVRLGERFPFGGTVGGHTPKDFFEVLGRGKPVDLHYAIR